MDVAIANPEFRPGYWTDVAQNDSVAKNKYLWFMARFLAARLAAAVGANAYDAAADPAVMSANVGHSAPSSEICETEASQGGPVEDAERRREWVAHQGRPSPYTLTSDGP
jgi:hypothetical protein